MTRRVRRSADDFYGIMQSFEEQGPVHGRPLSLTPLFAGSFTADPVSGGPTGGGCGGVCTPGKPSCASRHDPEFAPAVRDFKEMYCTTYAHTLARIRLPRAQVGLRSLAAPSP
eukprot:COSAG04_NODE_3099_length_3175_cov_3.037061_2_plen_113_part_00